MRVSILRLENRGSDEVHLEQWLCAALWCESERERKNPAASSLRVQLCSSSSRGRLAICAATLLGVRPACKQASHATQRQNVQSPAAANDVSSVQGMNAVCSEKIVGVAKDVAVYLKECSY